MAVVIALFYSISSGFIAFDISRWAVGLHRCYIKRFPNSLD